MDTPHDVSTTAGDGRLRRSRDGRILAGVASGVADHFALDPTLVRIGFVLLALFGGMAVPLYLAAWVVIPDEGSDRSLAEEWCGRDPIGGVHG
jgi:phage shock protein C